MMVNDGILGWNCLSLLVFSVCVFFFFFLLGYFGGMDRKSGFWDLAWSTSLSLVFAARYYFEPPHPTPQLTLRVVFFVVRSIGNHILFLLWMARLGYLELDSFFYVWEISGTVIHYTR